MISSETGIFNADFYMVDNKDIQLKFPNHESSAEVNRGGKRPIDEIFGGMKEICANNEEKYYMKAQVLNERR